MKMTRLIGYSEWRALTQHGLHAPMFGGSAGHECSALHEACLLLLLSSCLQPRRLQHAISHWIFIYTGLYLFIYELL
jgi:hypothetical protein